MIAGEDENILSQLCEGKTLKEIADQFGCSQVLLSQVIRRMRREYGASNNIHLAHIYTKKVINQS